MPSDVTPAQNAREAGEETLWALILTGTVAIGGLLLAFWWAATGPRR